jgi:REP element-mobilizing transposase RayT
MGHIYYKNWVHLIWCTKDRFPFLKSEIRLKVFGHILEKAGEKGYYIDTINGYTDHVHILMSLNPKIAISEAVNIFKGEVSHWLNSEKLTPFHFSWQDGYSVFSVSESQVDKVRNYINNQETHHKNISYIDELKKILELHIIKFNQN